MVTHTHTHTHTHTYIHTTFSSVQFSCVSYTADDSQPVTTARDQILPHTSLAGQENAFSCLWRSYAGVMVAAVDLVVPCSQE